MNNIVFWHGWGMSPSVWQPLTHALIHFGNFDVTCQTPALPGYEKNRLKDNEHSSNWVDIMMASTTNDIILCAWSMGAIMALDAANRYADKIKKLILFGATPCFINKVGWEYGLSPKTAQHFKEGIQANSKAMLKRFIMLFNQNDCHAKAITRQLSSLPYPPDDVLLKGLDFLHHSDFRPIMANIHQPVLIIHGENDPLMPVNAAKWLSNTLPNASLSILPNTAHAPFLSQPTQCANIIQQFLQS